MTNFMKGAMLHATIVAAFAVFVSCESNQSNSAKDSAEDRNEERFDDSDKQDDAQFLVNAAEINHEEIAMGKLAQQKGTSNEVRDLGKMMEEAHTKSLNELKALAKSKNITIPNRRADDKRGDYDDFNNKSGDDFDKDYADRMVDRHEDAISTFEDAAEDSHDAEIRRWASSSISELRAHHNHAKEAQRTLTNKDSRDSNRNSDNTNMRNTNDSDTRNTGTGNTGSGTSDKKDSGGNTVVPH